MDPAVKLLLESVVPAMNPVPAMVMLVAAAPATTVDGVKVVIFGPFTVRVLAAEAAVLVFFTTRLSVPAVAMELAGRVTVIEVAVPAVATSGVLLEPTYTLDPAVKLLLVSVVPAMKLVPVMVRVVLAAPAVTDAGLNEVMDGPLTVNVLAAEVAVLVFFTVMLLAPGVTMAVAGTVAVMEVAVPAVTVNCVVPM